MNRGLAPHQAAGLVGNLMRESGASLDIKARNPSGGAFGLAQWLGARQKNLFAKYGRTPSLQQQLDYIWHELNTTHKKGLQTLMASKDATEAAKNAFGWYEFHVGPERAVAEMNKYRQNGMASLNKGISNAALLMGQPIPENIQLNIPQRNTFAMQPQMYQIQQPQMAYNPFDGWQFQNESILNGSYNPERDSIIVNQAQQLAQLQAAYDKQEKERLLAAQQQALAQEREAQRNRTNLALQMVGMMGGDDSDNSYYDMWKPLINMGAYGGHLYGDGSWMNKIRKSTSKFMRKGRGAFSPIRDSYNNFITKANKVQREFNAPNAWSGGVEGLVKPEYYDPIVNPFGQALRDRMYKKVIPQGYTTENIRNFLWGDDRKEYLDLNTEALYGKYTGQDSIIGSSQRWYNSAPGREISEQEAARLGINWDPWLRKAAVSDLVRPSSIKKGAFELFDPYPSEIPDETDVRKQLHNRSLGTYTVMPGEDKNGRYLDYKDTWDINPYIGVSKNDDELFSIGPSFGLRKFDNIVPWGLPFDIYGRIYTSDIEDMNSPWSFDKRAKRAFDEWRANELYEKVDTPKKY
jgi:hypothetical protein